MSETRMRVLQMLQEGAITAAEAKELLDAMESGETAVPEPPTLIPEPDSEPFTGDIITPDPPPDMTRFRRFWQIPFFISLALLLGSGLWLRSLYQRADGAITFGFVCVWSIFIFTVVLTTLALLSRQSPWVHVRVKEQHGRRIAISLPIPMGLAKWGINIARGFVPDKEQASLDMAADFLAEARHNLGQPGADPLIVSVDDDDGDQVQVYIG
ncbi:MAG: hypothetical protein ACE5FD_14635 [Anaerolineae bacterium]